MAVKRVVIAKSRGFCAGVVRAIEILERALELFAPPIYIFHEIVHNQYVVANYIKRNAIFVNSLDEVPEGAVCIFSAHGVPPQVRELAFKKFLRVIDATCPLVTKVHLEAIRYAREGNSLILIGQAGHDEVLGTIGEAPMQLVSSVNDVQRLEVPNPDKVVYLTQTTLSLDDVAQITESLHARFPAVKPPSKDDICYATQNRQNAVKEMAAIADLILVIGSQNSSNSRHLCEMANATGTLAYLIDDYTDIKPEWLIDAEVVGLTSGASVPEELLVGVLSFLRSLGAQEVEDLRIQDEGIRFSVPQEAFHSTRRVG